MRSGHGEGVQVCLMQQQCAAVGEARFPPNFKNLARVPPSSTYPHLVVGGIRMEIRVASAPVAIRPWGKVCRGVWFGWSMRRLQRLASHIISSVQPESPPPTYSQLVEGASEWRLGLLSVQEAIRLWGGCTGVSDSAGQSGGCLPEVREGASIPTSCAHAWRPCYNMMPNQMSGRGSCNRPPCAESCMRA